MSTDLETTGQNTPADASNSEIEDSEDDFAPLRCWDCNVSFTTKEYLYRHLFHHIKQPCVVVEKLQLPPLKITLKSRSGNSFEIVNSPSHSITPPALGSPSSGESPPEDSFFIKQEILPPATLAEGGVSAEPQKIKEERKEVEDAGPEEDQASETNVSFSPTFADVQGVPSPAASSPASNSGTRTPQGSDKDSRDGASSATDTIATSGNTPEYGSIPGAEPTPPPEPSPDYPKIRIKTTGLLKESLTITEITDENPTGDPTVAQNDNSTMWSTPSLEDPLKLPDSDDNNILALFNNNDKAKDYGFCSSDSEYISLDRLGDGNRGTMQLYNPQTSTSSQNPLDSLTGLPMQALAQQVSRLQPSGGGNGMHQQNVLINIQQFPSAPQPSYQPPPMYPHHPQAPMYPPYQYQPPNPMYYPPAPGYPPQHMPPPLQPQMNQMQPPNHGHQQPMGQPALGPAPMGQPPNPMVSQSQNMNQLQQPPAYRQPMPPRQAAPRQQTPGQRMPMGPRQPMGARQPVTRQRAPMMRPRGTAPIPARGPRPRMGAPQNGQVRPQNSPVKRAPEPVNQMQAKKKRLDLLTPDKDDDDCQVICTQPKNTDGGLPQIESVQGGTSEPSESSIMHLSDSITLSVRNPPPKPAETAKKSDASAVANILATRGITVTATAKPKEKESPTKSASAAMPSSLNLNGAVSILPAAKTNGNAKAQESLPTVDLTDDSNPAPSVKQAASPQKQRPGLPYRCDLCPAQYPSALGLNKHRQSFHKTSGGMCELGIPLINLKQAGVMQKLASIGISNYIPLPSSGGDGIFALPIISTRNPGNVAALGATQMLNLGPVRAIPKPQNNANPAVRQVNQKT